MRGIYGRGEQASTTVPFSVGEDHDRFVRRSGGGGLCREAGSSFSRAVTPWTCREKSARRNLKREIGGKTKRKTATVTARCKERDHGTSRHRSVRRFHFILGTMTRALWLPLRRCARLLQLPSQLLPPGRDALRVGPHPLTRLCLLKAQPSFASQLLGLFARACFF